MKSTIYTAKTAQAAKNRFQRGWGTDKTVCRVKRIAIHPQNHMNDYKIVYKNKK